MFIDTKVTLYKYKITCQATIEFQLILWATKKLKN